MRALLVPLLLSPGCTAATVDGSEVAMPAGSSSAACAPEKAQVLVGQAASADLAARAVQLTGARTVRWIRPGDMVTMDFREDRLNIELDAQGRVTLFRCG